MTHYSEELKASIIARMLPPQNASVPALAKETGIPKDTLYCWRLKARGRSNVGPERARQGGAFSSEEKFAIVFETASFNELELGEYCRRMGLYPEQIASWKKAFIQGSNPMPSKAEREQLQQQARTIKQLQSELHRKDRALAEAAALLVLEKKIQALWGDTEDEKSTSRSAKK
jgi:transposase-like protein